MDHQYSSRSLDLPPGHQYSGYGRRFASPRRRDRDDEILPGQNPSLTPESESKPTKIPANVWLLPLPLLTSGGHNDSPVVTGSSSQPIVHSVPWHAPSSPHRSPSTTRA